MTAWAAAPGLAAAVAAAGCASVTPAPEPPTPMPPALIGTEFRASDGKHLPFTRWLPPQGRDVEAVVVAVHGLSGAASDFWVLGDTLPRAGIAVYAPELRGQGNDPDEAARGDIVTRNDWVRDITAFAALADARHPGAPLFFYGESMGALLVMEVTSRVPALEPRGLILASPVVGLRRADLPWWKLAAVRAFSCLAPGRRVSITGLDPGHDGHTNRVTSTTTHDDRMAVTPHALPDVTLRLLREVGTMLRNSHQTAARITQPSLVLYTPNDLVTSAEQVEAFFENIRSPDKTKIRFDQSYHLILHDVERWNAADTVLQWVRQRSG